MDIHTFHVYNAGVNKRLNITLPDATVRILDRVAPKGDRSRFISRAVLHYVQTQGAANLREQLKQGALANATLNLKIVEDWFPAEQELWQKLDQEEQAGAPSRGAGKSTSRRSTRR